MTSTLFNDGWTVRAKKSVFESFQSASGDTPTVCLPHDALITTTRSDTTGHTGHTGYFPGAAMQYLKTFDVPEEHRSMRVTLELQGVYRDAMVYVNDVFAGQRPYGYSTFFIPLDAYLKYGASNTIRVEARTHEDSRWYAGVGIHRDARLHVTELVHILPEAGVQISTPDIDDQRAVVETATVVRNEGTVTAQRVVNTVLLNAHGVEVASDSADVTLRAGATATVRQRMYIRTPQLWSVDSPTLYTAASTLTESGAVTEQRETTFGLRTLRLDPQHGLRINGETVKLRGACIHHDNGILGAAAIARAEERRVQILKDAGFNAIRSAHNPLSQAMLDACDRLGMLVMDETFDMWAEGKSAFDYSLSFPEWWERDVEALVAKDYNHPSVIIYSIGNEIPETGNPLGADWGRKIAEKFRSLDSTRYLTNSINGMVSVLSEFMEQFAGASDSPAGVNDALAMGFMNELNASELVTDRTKESFAVVDIAGLNYSDSRYVTDAELFPNRLIIGTETFPTQIATLWRLVEENPHVLGDFTWTGWDYLGETGIGRMQYLADGETAEFSAPYPWIAAWCGDIDITGVRRPASYYRETVFGLRHVPYIAVQRPRADGRTAKGGPWSWSDAISSWSWDVEPATVLAVEVYSDADEIELVLNDRVIGRQKTGSEQEYRTQFDVAYETGTLTAVGYTNGAETGRETISSAAGDVNLDVHPDRDRIIADSTDLSYVTIELRDAAGNLASNADRLVNVDVSGAGILQALGSARPETTEGFDSSEHTTFDGRVLAIVRPTGAGEITVEISAPGTAPVRTLITAEAPHQPGAAPARDADLEQVTA